MGLYKLVVCAALGLLSSIASHAFEAVASPPRLELSAKTGQVVRGLFELTNAGKKREIYTFKTMDWTFSKDAAVQMQDELLKDSCRPWVKIERPTLTLNGNQKYKYRFEVEVPANTEARECRFLIAIDGDAQAVVGGPPVAGRLGIVVYVNVGGSKADLVVKEISLKPLNGEVVPIIDIQNNGTAHGRVNGFLKLVDANGLEFDVSPSTFPILPGEARAIFLQPESDLELWKKVKYPAKVTGKLEWAGGKFELNSIVK